MNPHLATRKTIAAHTAAGPQNRFEAAAAKLLGYPIFWNRGLRNAFRFKVLQIARPLLGFLFRDTLRTLSRKHGERLVERRISVLGIPVFVRRRTRSKYRVALLVDEFFGAWDTPIGGYGALARKYICRHVPNDEIEIDVLLGVNEGKRNAAEHFVDGCRLIRLPDDILERQIWLDAQAYNLFVSIEMTAPSFWLLKPYRSSVPLLYMIQDPRDLQLYQPRLASVQRLRDDDWSYINDVAQWMGEMMRQQRVVFVSQGESLSEIARKMYGIPADVSITALPNPVELDLHYKLNEPGKENKVIFLGRLEAQKRVWIVCEVARAMPHYEFYVLGATGKGRHESENARSLEPYRYPDGSSRIPNLHFVGHVDGEIKNQHIRTAKLLLNTSIWEGIPISWLEALSYGTLIVSAFDRDDMVSRFGTYVGEITGDGTDPASIDLFTKAIDYWMQHPQEFEIRARDAIAYVRAEHGVPTFAHRMRTAIMKAIA